MEYFYCTCEADLQKPITFNVAEYNIVVAPTAFRNGAMGKSIPMQKPSSPFYSPAGEKKGASPSTHGFLPPEQNEDASSSKSVMGIVLSS